MTTHVAPGPHPAHGAGGPEGHNPKTVIPNARGHQPQDRPPVAPWTIVAIWGVLLGILAAVSAGMGNNLVVLEISGGAAVLALAIAAAVWLDHRLRPHRGVCTLPVGLGGTFLFAATALTAWLALAFGQYMLYLAVVPLTGAIGLEAAARRFRRDHAAAARAETDLARQRAR